jgi:hypothetical protein
VVDTLLAVVAVAVLLVAALTALLGVTVGPFLAALGAAEARRASPARAGVAAASVAVLGLVAAVAVFRSGAPALLAAVPLALGWVVPPVVAQLPAPLAGRAGRHERLPQRVSSTR